MTTMGELLRGGRDRAGMTVEEVADATNMPRDTIVALEQDDISVLPGGPFTRGFIRIYSRVLGIPAEPVLEAYSRALGAQQYVLDEPVRQLRRLRYTRIVAGVVAQVNLIHHFMLSIRKFSGLNSFAKVRWSSLLPFDHAKLRLLSMVDQDSMGRFQ